MEQSGVETITGGTVAAAGATRGSGLFQLPSRRHGGWFGTSQQLLAVVAAGLVLSGLSLTAAAVAYKASLRVRVAGIAEALDGQRITGLQQVGAGTAPAGDEYTYLQQHLQRIQAAEGAARIYLLGRRDDGSVYLLVGTDGPAGPSVPGAGRPGGLHLAGPAALALFDSGRAIVAGPSGADGDLSGLAPVFDEQSRSMTAVLGLDVPGRTYVLTLAAAGGIPLLLTALAASLLVRRSQLRQRRQNNIAFRAEMISIASHELRTPLTGLRWSAENMLSKKLSPQAMHRSMEIVYDSAMRLHDSIEDILQLASMDSERAQQLMLRPADIRAMLQDVAAVQRLPAEQHHVALQFGAGWPEKLELSCDARRLKRVFNNLLSNAIKYSRPDTQVTIGYQRTAGGHVISFQDQGIGIPAAEQPKVLSGFYRASNVMAQDVSGTGMGLYLSKAIVEQHGGSIRLESAEGKGTTVFVSLPDDTAEA